MLAQAEVVSALRSVTASAGEPLPPPFVQALPDDGLWDAIAAAAREPRTALGAFARGLLNLRLPNGPAAVTQFELALERAPASTAALRYLGAAHAASGNDRDAAGAWQFALDDPSVARTWRVAHADALVRAGDRPAAADLLRALRAQAPDDRGVLVRLIEVELAEGRIVEAAPLVEQLNTADPEDADASWWRVVLAFADAVDPDRPGAVETFVALADRYVERNRPRSDLVRTWMAAVR